MSRMIGALRAIGGRLKLSNIIAAIALFLSIPAISLTIDQIIEKDRVEEQRNQKVEQIERQLGYARDQVEQSRLQSESAKLSAAAAASSAAELRQQNQFAERALIIQRYTSYQNNRPRIEFLEVDKIEFSESEPTKWVARFTKMGTPPSNVRTWVFSEVKLSGSSIPDFPQCQSEVDYNNRGSFQKGAIFARGPKISQQQSNLISNGKHLFVMGGRVCYNDDEGGLHATDFCISAHGTNENWAYGSCAAMNSSYTIKIPPEFDLIFRNSNTHQ